MTRNDTQTFKYIKEDTSFPQAKVNTSAFLFSNTVKLGLLAAGAGKPEAEKKQEKG